MTTAGPPVRSSRGPYVLAAALFGVALLIAAVLAVIVIRAISGYAITPVTPGEPIPITVGERDVTIWSSPEARPSACSATDTAGQTATRVGMMSVSVTDGGLTWHRVTTINGPPGTYTLTCEAASGTEFGYGPSPRIGKYVLMGVVGGGAALFLTVASFVIFLVTILRRRNRRPAVAPRP
jgi:hypothetical protein